MGNSIAVEERQAEPRVEVPPAPQRRTPPPAKKGMKPRTKTILALGAVVLLAILVIAGDVDSAEVRPLAETYFGPIPSQSWPARVRVEEPPHYAAVRLEMKSARAAQPRWNRSYLAPSYRAGETAQPYPLQVLA